MKLKRTLAALLVVLLIGAFAGCSQSPDQSKSPAAKTSSEAKTDKTDKADKADKKEGATYKFTDSAGREVDLPKNIERIAPSGPLAQVVLYTLCPDKLVGLAGNFSDDQFKYIDKKYEKLPVFGNLYGDTLNLEAIMSADPQVIIDVGEPKKSVKEDMNGIQEKTGIPTIFVHMEMDSMVSAYNTLGEVTGEKKQAQKLMDYIEKTQTDTAEKVKTIPDDKRVKVYYGQDEGLTAIVKGTVHSDVIDAVGAINVADVEKSVRGGASQISMEQLLLWNPDVILFGPGSIYDKVSTLPEWQGLNAIKNGKYYEVPQGPYNWMGRPPSVNRVLGIKWLSNLLYPDVFPYDMVKETKDFYKLFYHCDVTDGQVKDLLSKSTFKK